MYFQHYFDKVNLILHNFCWNHCKVELLSFTFYIVITNIQWLTFYYQLNLIIIFNFFFPGSFEKFYTDDRPEYASLWLCLFLYKFDVKYKFLVRNKTKYKLHVCNTEVFILHTVTMKMTTDKKTFKNPFAFISFWIKRNSESNVAVFTFVEYFSLNSW